MSEKHRPTFDTFDEGWVSKVLDRVSKKGIDSYLGLKVTAVEPGRLTCEMPVTDELITMMGNMHGGCLSAMCDHVLGVVMYPVMPPGSWAATTEFKINLLAPVTVASASPRRRSSRCRSDSRSCGSRWRTKVGSWPSLRAPRRSSPPGRTEPA